MDAEPAQWGLRGELNYCAFCSHNVRQFTNSSTFFIGPKGAVCSEWNECLFSLIQAVFWRDKSKQFFFFFPRTVLLDRRWNDHISAAWSRPVQDSFVVQEHERRRDLCGVETCSGLFKLSGLLDVEHEITAVYELHHKEETVLQKCREEEMTFPHGHPKRNNLRVARRY